MIPLASKCPASAACPRMPDSACNLAWKQQANNPDQHDAAAREAHAHFVVTHSITTPSMTAQCLSTCRSPIAEPVETD